MILFIPCFVKKAIYSSWFDDSEIGAVGMHYSILKGIVHLKMKILSSFTHPQVVPNLYECLCSAEHKGRYSEECGKQQFWGTSIFFPTTVWKSMVQRHSYRFGTTWGWVNDDRMNFFGWAIPLRLYKALLFFTGAVCWSWMPVSCYFERFLVALNIYPPNQVLLS